MLPITVRDPARAPRDRGFALLIVLWSLVLLSLIGAQTLAAGRNAVALAGNIRAAAQAQAGADGAIYAAIYHLSATDSGQWLPDGSQHLLDSDGMAVAVRVTSLGGKINPNLASTALLAGFFQALGAAPVQAQNLANAIIDWRSTASSASAAQAIQAEYKRAGLVFAPPGRNFADLSELGAVIGMPPALLARAMPDMSLFQTSDPDTQLADQVVRRALALSGQAGLNPSEYSGTSPVFVISAEAGMTGTLDVHRQAIVTIGGANGPAAYQILSVIPTAVGSGR